MPLSSNSPDPVAHSISEPGGLKLTCSNLGAAIVKLQVPYKDACLDVVTGYSNVKDSVGDPYYMGAMCGRYAGRIKDATFSLNGKHYNIDTPGPGEHALHGGTHGFNTRCWERAPSRRDNEVTYTLNSSDGDQGFPGCLSAQLTYAIENRTHLVVNVEAQSNRDTIVNLVNHAYFNLNSTSASINNHCLSILADKRTVLDAEGIPTGDIVDVEGTRFDLRHCHEPYAKVERQLLGDCQLDQNYVLGNGQALTLAALVSVTEHPVCLAVHTTLPGLQVYTGDQLGGVFEPRSGLCLEAQHFPDAPNQTAFPSAVLRAGELYRSKTIYAFGEQHKVIKL